MGWCWFKGQLFYDSTYNIDHEISVPSAWLILPLCPKFHFYDQKWQYFVLFNYWIIIHFVCIYVCTYTIYVCIYVYFLCLFINSWMPSFIPFIGFCNWTTMNTEVQCLFDKADYITSGYIHKRARSYSSCNINFWKPSIYVPQQLCQIACSQAMHVESFSLIHKSTCNNLQFYHGYYYIWDIIWLWF